ncbi:MAG: DUF4114 domain-containing protein [Cyanobacteria bacterium J06632_3]
MSVIFVNQNASGNQDGSSWQNAFIDLQAAIALAVDGDEIWVAQGTYVPGSSRSATFAISNAIEIYGGFDGSETQKSERDWQLNPTILSGEIGIANDITDNVHHVVTAQSVGGARLDGVIVEAGNTAGDTNNDDGGGIYNRETLTLENVIVRNNSANDDGGGIRNDGALTVINSTVDANKANSSSSVSSGGGGLINTVGATTTVVNSTFSHNEALNGGAIRNDGSLTLTNTTLSGNIAYESGGGLVNTTTNPFSAEALTASATLVNSTITNNTAQDTGLSGIKGGGIANFGSLNIANTIVAGNVGNDDINDVFSGRVVSDGHNLIGNVSQTILSFVAAKGDFFGNSEAALDPLLGSLQDNGGFTKTHALTEGSIAIDNGGNAQLATDATDLDGDDNTTEGVPFDQRGSGFDRVVDDSVDIGAVEFSASSSGGDGGDGGERIGNTPPTAIVLENTIQSLPENTPIESPLRVADIVVSDDGLGSHTFSIVGRYDDLFEAIAPDIFETIATEYFAALDEEVLTSIDGEFLEAIATEFFEAVGAEFFDIVADEFLDAIDAESGDEIDEAFLEELAEEFIDTVDADFFETIVTEFLSSIDLEDFDNVADSLLNQLDGDFFETLALEFLDEVDAAFFETLASEFLAAVDADDLDDIDAALLEETARELLGVTDPDIFEIVGDGLFLRAGTELDFERQEHYNIVVQVDDPTVGIMPDAFVDFSFLVEDVDDSPLNVSENQLLKVLGDEAESLVSVSVEQATQNAVYEIVVAETDEDGGIDGVLPGEAGYLDALIAASWSVLSTLEAGTFDDLDGTRSLMLASDSYYQFAVIKDGTLDSLLENGVGSVQLGAPLTSDAEGLIGGILQATSIAHGEVQLGFDLSDNGVFDDIVLTAIFGDGGSTLGAGLQGGQESELLDLREVSGSVAAEFTVYREADFDNVIGFFAIENEQGQVRGLDDQLISPGEAGYIQAAIARRLSVELTSENGQVSTYSAQVDGGQLLSTFIVSNGSIADLLDDDAGNDPAVYFTHLGANADGSDHVRLLGDNIFGFEDMAGGGDQDFDDVVIKTVLG